MEKIIINIEEKDSLNEGKELFITDPVIILKKPVSNITNPSYKDCSFNN